MRYRVAAAVIIAMLAGRAYAQDTHEANQDPYQLMLKHEREEREQNEKAYNQTMKRLKAQDSGKASSSDPWKKVRPSSDGAAKR